MFRFEHIEFLWALGIIPVLTVFFILAAVGRQRALRRFGDPRLVARIAPDMPRYKHSVKFAVLMLALALIIIGWANPQWGIKKEKVQRKGIDLFIALDISESMLAEDVSPSRLERSRRFAQNLVNRLKGENIGVILFACNAYLQVPLTTDYAFVDLFINSAHPSMAPSQGTAIAEAVDLAERSFPEGNKNHKALVIVSDGEDHQGTALDRVREARENGLLTFSVGVGDANGGFIPTLVAGRADYKRDESGNPIRSRLEENTLREIADAGGGAYFNLLDDSNIILETLQERIDRIEKQEFEQRVFNEYESYFQFFIGLGLLLLLIEFIISYRRNRFFSKHDIFAS